MTKPKVKLRARPWIFFGLANHASMYGIEFDVACSCDQMIFIQNTRTKATLKKIAMHTIREVFHPCIAAVSFAYRSSENPRVLRNRNQMSVICHQAPRQNLDTKPVELFGENFKVCFAILIAVEDGDGANAPLSHVMGIPRRHYSGNSSHEADTSRFLFFESREISIMSPEFPPR